MSASSINNNVFLFFYLFILCVLASATQPSTSVENEILARQNKQMASSIPMFLHRWRHKFRGNTVNPNSHISKIHIPKNDDKEVAF